VNPRITGIAARPTALKHQPLLRVDRPTARLLCQLSYEHTPDKIL
jgi:hypothetical protein